MRASTARISQARLGRQYGMLVWPETVHDDKLERRRWATFNSKNSLQHV